MIYDKLRTGESRMQPHRFQIDQRHQEDIAWYELGFLDAPEQVPAGSMVSWRTYAVQRPAWRGVS